jgi:peptide/nickel transport system substrate-binding protein
MTRIDLMKLAAGCGMAVALALAPATAQEQPQYGGTLNVSLPNDAKSLDPVFQVNFSERQPLYLIFNTLVGLTPDFSIIPELAERWELDNAAKRLVLHLRAGVKFHDGTDFNADAVKWNLDHRMDEKTKSPSRVQLIEMISSVDVKDPRTVVINLKGPAPNLLGMLAQREGFMASPTAAMKAGEGFGTNPVGSGPFVFKEWEPGNRIVVEKNPNYWEKGKPYLDRIVFIQTANPVVSIPRLMTRELDYIAQLGPNDVRPIEKRPGIKLDVSPGNRWTSFQFVVDKPPFDNLKLRQALAHALDRKRIVDIVMNGKAEVADGPTPPGLWWYHPKLPVYDYNPAKAKALLAEIGYKSDQELKLSVQPVALYQQISQLAQEQFKAVGINVRIEPVSVSEWYPLLFKGVINFLPIRWTQRPDPDGLLTYLFYSKSAVNSSRYTNLEVDDLLARARGLDNRDDRVKLYAAAQEHMARDLPYLSLFFSIEYAAMRDEVKNHVWIPDEIPRFREVWKAVAR